MFQPVCRWSLQPFLASCMKMRSTCDFGLIAKKNKFSKLAVFPELFFLKIKNSTKAFFYLWSISSYKVLVASNIFHYEISRYLVAGKQWEIRECRVIGLWGVYGEEAACEVTSRVQQEKGGEWGVSSNITLHLLSPVLVVQSHAGITKLCCIWWLLLSKLLLFLWFFYFIFFFPTIKSNWNFQMLVTLSSSCIEYHSST